MRLFAHLNPKSWKIHTKISALFFLTILLSTLILSGNNYLSLSNGIKEQSGKAHIVLGHEIYQHYIDLMQVNINKVLTLSQMNEIIATVQSNGQLDQGQQSFYTRVLENNAQFKSILICDPNGVVLYNSAGEGNQSIAQHPGYTQLQDGDIPYNISNTQSSDETQQWFSDITIPLFKQSAEQRIGYMQISLDISSIFEVLDQINIGQTGTILIINNGYQIIYSAQRSQIGSLVTEINPSALTSENPFWYTIQNKTLHKPELISVIPGQSIPENDLQGALLIKQNVSELYLPIRGYLIRNWIIALVSLLVLSMLGYFISQRIFRPINIINTKANYLSRGDLGLMEIDHEAVNSILEQQDELGETGRAFSSMIDYFRDMSMAAAEIAMGNLAHSIEPKSDEDALGNAFMLMIAALRETISDMNDQAVLLKSAAISLTGNAEESSSNIQQISYTMQQVSDGTEEQAESIQQTLTSVSELSRAIDGVANGAQEQAEAVQNTVEITGIINQIMTEVGEFAHTVAESSQVAADSANNSSNVVQETIQGMMRIKQTVDQSVVKVTEMGNRSQQVESILETINDIAGQTNLLALNAAIEAARAGEHGKGFAVVAEEVRKLAERSAAATREIANIIDGIQKSVQDAVSVMEDGVSEVQTGVQLANNAGEALGSIHRDINTLNVQAEQVEIAMRSMTNSVNDLVKSSETVSAVVEENTAATEEMAASSSELTMSIQGISTISDENKALIEMVANSTASLFQQADQVTSAAQELMTLADHLANIVEQYQLEE
ncbi:MAG: methyl-accepting chemotaxis protein [Anaerolineaceae bacterium]|nr:methyl-accepting chemotaxis protein [Anaerolineaceae bacterium]